VVPCGGVCCLGHFKNTCDDDDEDDNNKANFTIFKLHGYRMYGSEHIV